MAYTTKQRAKRALRDGTHTTPVIKILGRMAKGLYARQNTPEDIWRQVEAALMAASRRMSEDRRDRIAARAVAEIIEEESPQETEAA